MPKTDLLLSTAPTSYAIPTMSMTPIERSMGRLMRAPDHDGGGGDPAPEGGDNGDEAKPGEGADQGDNGDGPSVLGDADASEGAGDAGDDQSKDGESGDADDEPDGKGKDGDVPEAYSLKLTVDGKDAEGNDVQTEIEMDKALVEEATPVLKDLKLSNEAANKLVALVPKVQARVLEQQRLDHQVMRAQWAREAEADKEIGGAKWKETIALSAKALDHYGAPKGSEFRKLLTDTGLDNHPVMISMFRKIGAAIAEDTKLERDETNPQGKKDKLTVLYPDDVPKK